MATRSKTSTSSRIIPVSKLEADNFAAFGRVVQNPETHNGQPALESAAANQSSALKYLDATHLTNWYGSSTSKKPAKPVVNLFVCQPRQLDMTGTRVVFPVTILERHPFTAQTFIPMGLAKEDQGTRYLVIVAPTLPLRSRGKHDALTPPYPLPSPRKKRSFRERLISARPNLFTNDFSTTTTPPTTLSTALRPKGPGLPDLENSQAFVARGDQAVTYGPGTWHAPMVVLGERAVEFVVVQNANGVPVEDCQEIEIEARFGEPGLEVDVDGVIGNGIQSVRAKL